MIPLLSSSLTKAACLDIGGEAAQPQSFANSPYLGPTTINVLIGGEQFTAVVTNGAAKSCIWDNIRRRLQKVLTPPSGHFLCMGNGDLVTTIGFYTLSFSLGVS